MEYNAKVLQKGKYGHLAEVALERSPKKPSPLRLGEEVMVHQRVLDTIQVGAKYEPILSLHRFKVWWMRPNFQHPVPPETLFILENVGNGDGKAGSGAKFRLILPVVLPRQDGHDYASASLRGRLVDVEGQEHEELILCGNKNEAGLYVGVSDDPYALIQEGVTLATHLWESTRTPPVVTTRLAPTNNVALEKLGWCTWNAFYTALDGLKVVEAIRTLQQKHDIPIRWMILDDGWQHITERTPPKEAKEFSSSAVTGTDPSLDGNQWTQRLESFREDPKKFHAQDLKETVRQLREDLGMKAVWVWHTLAGYWMGVNSESEAFSKEASSQSKIQYPHFPPGILDNDASASMESSVGEGIGITTDARDFFKQYHTDYLSEVCGVDGIKVDAQGVVGVLKQEKWNEDHESSAHASSTEAPVLRLHNALAESVKSNFATAHPQKRPDTRQSPSIIHCMAHAPEIFYRLPALYQRENKNDVQQLPLYRAADDFYPENKNSHAPQVVACAYNSLLFQHLAIPDWDMFATTGVDQDVLRYHAVARCISGGPIYFSSSPNDLLNYKERPVWIDWISCKDGTTLPCRGTGLPTKSCLLQDPLAAGKPPFVIWNTNGGGDDNVSDIQKIDGSRIANGVLGAFHFAGCGKWDYKQLNYVTNSEGTQEEPKTVHLRPRDIPFFKDSDTSFLAVGFFSESVRELKSPGTALSLILGPRETEVVTMYPIKHQVRAGSKKSLEVVPLGFEEMINGGGAVLDVESSDTTSTMDLDIRGCGSLLLAVRAIGSGHASDFIDDVGVSVEVNKKPITTRHTFCPDRSQAASEAGLPSRVSLRKNLVEAGFDVLVVDIPDIAATKDEKSEKPQLQHVKLNFSG